MKANPTHPQGARQGRHAHDRYLSRPNGAAVAGAARALSGLYAPVTEDMPDSLMALAARLDEAMAGTREPETPAEA